MKRHILITGGAGFIGSRLALFLTSRGHHVKVLDVLAPQIHGPDPDRSPLYGAIRGKVDFMRGSVTSREDLKEALRDVDTVVHLAAETGTGQSMYAIQHYSDVNIGGTALLLDLIANEPFPVARIVVASSRAVYGEGKYHCTDHGVVFPPSRLEKHMSRGDFEPHCPVCDRPAQSAPTDEQTPVCPGSIYGVTKLTQEQLVLTVAGALGISAVAFRYQNVYGPGQSLANPYTGILSIFSSRIRNRRSLNIFEDGKESRDFVFIDDVVAATASAIELEENLVETINIGSGVATDVMSVACSLQALLAITVPTSVSGQFRVGDIRHNVADLAKARRILNYSPEVRLAEGLGRFVAWANGEQMPVDRYEESLDELRKKGLFR